ncbi:MAG: S-layer homology domain-containing protein, partial [Armatimonadetes bacterium]|nr:S-layer homology domain-containing protein [Armatimonadota bacterium]
VPPATPTFLDLGTWHWAYKHIEFIAEAGIATGYPDGYYRPNADCTRDQMAVYIARGFGLMPE